MLKTRWFFAFAAVLLVANAGCGKGPKGDAQNGAGTSGSGQMSSSNDASGSKDASGSDASKGSGGTAAGGAAVGGAAAGAAGSKSMTAGAGGASKGNSATGVGTRPGKGEVNEGILHTSEGWVLTEDDNGKVLNLHRGEMVLVRVGASKGNGYKWDVAGNENAVLKQMGPSVVAAGTSSSKTNRTETWKYEASQVGETSVQMNYLPPYSKTVPERVLKFSVAVK